MCIKDNSLPAATANGMVLSQTFRQSPIIRMHVPVIDFAQYDPDQLETLGGEVDSALSRIGFMSATNLGIDLQLLDDVFAASRSFFGSDLSQKMQCAYLSASENFGYQGMCEEHLDPSKPADLKETFTMRNVGLARASCSAPIMARVSGVMARCSVRKSEWDMRVSRSTSSAFS